MARKITLTVPEGLYYRIELWRSTFNLSRIFQDAVAEAIRRKEEFQKRIVQDSNIGEIVQRLRREKRSIEQRTQHAAAEEGRRWAATAHYADLVAVIHSSEEEAPRIPGGEAVIETTIRRLAEEHEGEFVGEEEYREAVVTGWRHGVLEFWEAIRDKL